jgi:hypothetical protein
MTPSTAPFLAGFPLTEHFLEHFRAISRKRQQTEQMGAHLRRRRGQSLEYLEHRIYQSGDDVRHIDWRASARLPNESDFLVRAYAAEDRVTLMLSLDDRSSMRRGDGAKLKLAAWVCYAIGRAAAKPGDRVFLHRLFGPLRPASEIRTRSARAQMANVLDKIIVRPPVVEDDSRVNTQSLKRLLRPTVVWVVVSDLYFDVAAGDGLAEQMRLAQRMNCWVLLIEIDTWRLERKALLDAASIEITAPKRHKFTFGEKEARLIDVDIQKHKSAFIEKAQAGSLGVSRWSWRPGETESGFFKERFEHDDNLRRFFRLK